jgi:hypothetical protein
VQLLLPSHPAVTSTLTQLPNDFLGAGLVSSPAENEVFITKASAFRSLIEAIRSHGLYDEVHARLPVVARKLVENPPFATSWMPAVAFQYLFRALWEVADEGSFCTIARDSVVTGPMKLMKPLIEGTIRLFGATPAAFYKRFPQVMESQIKGVTFTVVELTDDRAVITVTYEHLRDVPYESFLYWAAILEITNEICGRTGHNEVYVDTTDPRRNRGRLTLHWENA